jgi:hypothetical protein
MAAFTRKRSLRLAALSLCALLGTVFFLAWDGRGRLDHDMLILSMFFFAVPVIVLSSLLCLTAVNSIRRKRWIVALGEEVPRPTTGQCDACQTGFTATDIHCPGCGRSLSSRRVVVRMMSPYARDREQLEAERVRAELRERKRPAAVEAAKSLISLGAPHLTDSPEVIERCLTDPATAQRLYRTAALRLHPDQNGGEHLPRWFELQDGMKMLQMYYDLAAPAVVEAGAGVS